MNHLTAKQSRETSAQVLVKLDPIATEKLPDPPSEVAPFAVPIRENDNPSCRPFELVGELGEGSSVMDENDPTLDAESPKRGPVPFSLDQHDRSGFE